MMPSVNDLKPNEDQVLAMNKINMQGSLPVYNFHDDYGKAYEVCEANKYNANDMTSAMNMLNIWKIIPPMVKYFLILAFYIRKKMQSYALGDKY